MLGEAFPAGTTIAPDLFRRHKTTGEWLATFLTERPGMDVAFAHWVRVSVHDVGETWCHVTYYDGDDRLVAAAEEWLDSPDGQAARAEWIEREKEGLV